LRRSQNSCFHHLCFCGEAGLSARRLSFFHFSILVFSLAEKAVSRCRRGRFFSRRWLDSLRWSRFSETTSLLFSVKYISFDWIFSPTDPPPVTLKHRHFGFFERGPSAPVLPFLPLGQLGSSSVNHGFDLLEQLPELFAGLSVFFSQVPFRLFLVHPPRQVVCR